jgi:hypothetical protein
MNADIHGKKPSHPITVDKLWITAQLFVPSKTSKTVKSKPVWVKEIYRFTALLFNLSKLARLACG